MSTETPAAETSAADAPTSIENMTFGSIEDIQAELELPAEDAPGDKPAPAKEKPAGKPKDDKTRDSDATDDPDAAAIKAINARSAARHAARREREQQAIAARAQTAAKPKEDAPKPAETAKPKEEPAAALTKPQASAADAAKEVLSLIAKLAGDDAETAAAAEDPTVKQAAERAALVAEIKARLDGIEAATKKSDALETEVGTLKAKLEGIESARVVRDHIESKIEPVIAELPTLMAKRNAIEIVHAAVGKYWDKHQKLPDVAELARRIEKKLTEANAPEKTEKNAKPRKTVSSSLGSPPAARSGPDTRTTKEVEDDLFKSLGVA